MDVTLEGMMYKDNPVYGIEFVTRAADEVFGEPPPPFSWWTRDDIMAQPADKKAALIEYCRTTKRNHWE